MALGGGTVVYLTPPHGESAEIKRSSQSDVPLVFILRRDFFPTTVHSVYFYKFFMFFVAKACEEE